MFLSFLYLSTPLFSKIYLHLVLWQCMFAGMTYYVSPEENQAMDDFCKRQWNRLLFRPNPTELEKMSTAEWQRQSKKKWAKIVVDGKEIQAWVDNETMKAYQADGYERTDIEIFNFKFIRWMSSMEL